MPNLDYTKHVERTSNCAWHHVLYECYEIYGKLGDRAGRERCLQLLQAQPPSQDDKWFAIYLQAFLHADYGEYTRRLPRFKKSRKELNTQITATSTLLTGRK